MSNLHWIPLESNPEVLNKYAHSLGLSPLWNFMDVFSLDDEVLGMLPKPVAGLLFTYPITEQTECAPFGDQLEHNSQGCYFMKQTIANACGTVALIHLLANRRGKVEFLMDSILINFFAKSTNSTPEERARLMESDEGLNSAHEAAATEGQSAAPDRNSHTNLHFIALVNHNGRLLELDGRREGPVSHGETSDESFLADSAAVVRRFMARQSGELNFSIVALVRGESPF